MSVYRDSKSGLRSCPSRSETDSVDGPEGAGGGVAVEAAVELDPLFPFDADDEDDCDGRPLKAVRGVAGGVCGFCWVGNG